MFSLILAVFVGFFAGCPAEPEYQSDTEGEWPNPPTDLYAVLSGDKSVQLSLVGLGRRDRWVYDRTKLRFKRRCEGLMLGSAPLIAKYFH